MLKCVWRVFAETCGPAPCLEDVFSCCPWLFMLLILLITLEVVKVHCLAVTHCQHWVTPRLVNPEIPSRLFKKRWQSISCRWSLRACLHLAASQTHFKWHLCALSHARTSGASWWSLVQFILFHMSLLLCSCCLSPQFFSSSLCWRSSSWELSKTTVSLPSSSWWGKRPQQGFDATWSWPVGDSGNAPSQAEDPGLLLGEMSVPAGRGVRTEKAAS